MEEYHLDPFGVDSCSGSDGFTSDGDRKLCDYYEKQPDLYGIRRSDRARKGTARFDVSSVECKVPKRKLVYSTSDDSYGSSDGCKKTAPKRTTRGNRVSYIEQDADLSDASIEERKTSKKRYLDGKHSSRDAIEDVHQDTIDEVVDYRIGRRGAVGDQTTCYSEVDPNFNFDATTETGETHFLIKWRGWSHFHNTWESDSSLSQRNAKGVKKVSNFRSIMHSIAQAKREASADEYEVIEAQESQRRGEAYNKRCVDRIITHKKSPDGTYNDYYVKWKGMEYKDSTWEDGKLLLQYFGDSYDLYEKRCKFAKFPDQHADALRRRPRFIPFDKQPSYVGNGDLRLRNYQLDGLNWLARAWTRGNSVILADEMGLGKTIQTISFLSYLSHEHGIYGPFLLVVPLSVTSNWLREFAVWAPNQNCILYTGNQDSRNIIRNYEWYHVNKRSVKFNVCITTAEIIRKDKALFSSVQWAFLGVDEAHILKNGENAIYQVLKSLSTNTRLLITGTPLQNSLKELWSLLHFVMPHKFEDFEEFKEVNAIEGERISSLDRIHSTLEPYLLRRMKKDVEKSLPAKIEQLLRIDMLSMQKAIYKNILGRNFDVLHRGNCGKKASFINIIVELKKCCNHSRLVYIPEDYQTLHDKPAEEQFRILLKGSGKMMALDKLLMRFHRGGNRVLIFSQMVSMLDIIADYLSLRSLSFQRIDGTVSQEVRKQAIDHFNAPNSPDFCFLLSTRAGGLGVNLATADTVIIFDADWNPQNDLQAMARAHRIGQTKQVSVYRFVTKNSVEERIVEKAKQKMVLEHLVIHRMDTRGVDRSFSKNDFSQDELNSILKFGAEDLFREECNEDNDDVDIDDILRQAESRDVDNEMEGKNPAGELLKQFKVVNFGVEENADVVLVDKSGHAKSWSEIIPEDFVNNVKTAEEQQKILDLTLGPRNRKSRVDLSAPTKKPLEKFVLSDKDIKLIVKMLKKCGDTQRCMKRILSEVQCPDSAVSQVVDCKESIICGCRSVIQCGSNDKNAVFSYGKVQIHAKQLMRSVDEMKLLTDIVPDDCHFRLRFPVKNAGWDCEWTANDDSMLLVGVRRYGFDSWDAVKADSELGLDEKILPISLNSKPQTNHLRTRFEYLLKEIKKSNGADKSEQMEVKGLKKKVKAVVPKSKEFVESSHSSDGNHSKCNGVEIEEDLNEHQIKWCRGKLKSQRKNLEILQNADVDAFRQPERISSLLLVGECIKRVLDEESSEDRSSIRFTLWKFVALFTDVSTLSLHRIYKKAYNKRKKFKRQA